MLEDKLFPSFSGKRMRSSRPTVSVALGRVGQLARDCANLSTSGPHIPRFHDNAS
jgi:hypothetical protein